MPDPNGQSNHLRRARIWYNSSTQVFEHTLESDPLIEAQRSYLVTDWKFVDLKSETSFESDKFLYYIGNQFSLDSQTVPKPKAVIKLEFNKKTLRKLG